MSKWPGLTATWQLARVTRQKVQQQKYRPAGKRAKEAIQSIGIKHLSPVRTKSCKTDAGAEYKNGTLLGCRFEREVAVSVLLATSQMAKATCGSCLGCQHFKLGLYHCDVILRLRLGQRLFRLLTGFQGLGFVQIFGTDGSV